jgi:hypothetical protein
MRQLELENGGKAWDTATTLRGELAELRPHRVRNEHPHLARRGPPVARSLCWMNSVSNGLRERSVCRSLIPTPADCFPSLGLLRNVVLPRTV